MSIVLSFLMLVLMANHSFSKANVSAWWSSDHHVLASANEGADTSLDCFGERQHITFILGKDGAGDNPYFTHAAAYYKQESRPGFDTVITDLLSLQEVNEYLLHHPPANALPWGEIRLVVHSNNWTGLSAPITIKTKRTTEKGLKKAIEAGMLTRLPLQLSDSDTQLQLWGCGLGNNTILLQIMKEAFGTASVYSPKYFVQYRKDRWGKVKRYLNRCYYTTFPTGYRPSNTSLEKDLAKAYPNTKLNWRTALQTPAGSDEDKAYNYTFKVPLVWLVSYESKTARPRVKTQTEQIAWLQQQPELQSTLEAYELQQEAFTWTIYPKMHTFSDGITEPTIKAIGLCTILCVLEPIGEPESGQGVAFLPLAPSLDDTAYFACVD